MVPVSVRQPFSQGGDEWREVPEGPDIEFLANIAPTWGMLSSLGGVWPVRRGNDFEGRQGD